MYVRPGSYFDGGAYASSSAAVVGNGGDDGLRPVRGAERGRSDCYGVYTNNPPCGAMRGFGAVQTCFAYESQMDRCAGRAGPGPGRVPAAQRHVRGRRGADGPGHRRPGAGRGTAAHRAGHAAAADTGPPLTCGNCPAECQTRPHGEGVRRGVGYARRLSRTSGSPRASTTTRPRGCRLEIAGRPAGHRAHRGRRGRPGPGHVEAQIARTELGCDQVVVHPADTAVGSGGSSSASRQTYVTGGAVQAACERSAPTCWRSRSSGTAHRPGPAPGRRHGGLRRRGGATSLAAVVGGEVIEETVELAAPAHLPARPGDRAGQRARPVRVRRAPRRCGRRHRTRAGQGGRAGHRPGRRARRSTRRRSRARSRAAPRRAWASR